jgi:hypothetical protein
MRRFVPALLFFYLLQASSLQAQVVEYFTDGELGADPPWFGDTADFRVNAEGMLQLNAAAAGSSTIYTANYLCDSTEWLFRIRLTFSPSSNNYARIYLMADSLGPAGPFHGYFLQLGESGSADALTLCRDSAGQYHTLCRGPDGQIASAFDLEVKIIRSRKGSWILYAKETASPEYLWLAGAVDSCIRTTRWCSFSATYTSSNTSAFYLDDLIISWKPSVLPIGGKYYCRPQNPLRQAPWIEHDMYYNPREYKQIVWCKMQWISAIFACFIIMCCPMEPIAWKLQCGAIWIAIAPRIWATACTSVSRKPGMWFSMR